MALKDKQPKSLNKFECLDRLGFDMKHYGREKCEMLYNDQYDSKIACLS